MQNIYIYILIPPGNVYSSNENHFLHFHFDICDGREYLNISPVISTTLCYDVLRTGLVIFHGMFYKRPRSPYYSKDLQFPKVLSTKEVVCYNLLLK